MPAHFFLFVHVPKRLDSESFPYRWTPPIGLLEGKDWPDGYDRALTAIYLAVIFGLPILGYVFMVLDFRRYLRSLRRALVLVAQAVPVTPYWALRSRPNCLSWRLTANWPKLSIPTGAATWTSSCSFNATLNRRVDSCSLRPSWRGGRALASTRSALAATLAAGVLSTLANDLEAPKSAQGCVGRAECAKTKTAPTSNH